MKLSFLDLPINKQCVSRLRTWMIVQILMSPHNQGFIQGFLLGRGNTDSMKHSFSEISVDLTHVYTNHT